MRNFGFLKLVIQKLYLINPVVLMLIGYKQKYKYIRIFTIHMFQVGFNGFTEEAVEVAQQTFKLLEEEGNTLRYIFPIKQDQRLTEKNQKVICLLYVIPCSCLLSVYFHDFKTQIFTNIPPPLPTHTHMKPFAPGLFVFDLLPLQYTA